MKGSLTATTGTPASMHERRTRRPIRPNLKKVKQVEKWVSSVPQDTLIEGC